MTCDSGIHVEVIATGSAGNAVLLENSLLVDCGVPFKYLVRYIDSIRLVVISHKHRDHLNQQTVRRLAHDRPTVRFAVGSYLVKLLISLGISADRIDILRPRRAKNYGRVQIEPVELVHDVPNYGFRIQIDDKKILYATDTKNLNGINCPGYDLYMIEANYDEQEIADRIKETESNGDYAYERRVLRTHMSQQQADDYLIRNAGPNSEWMYMHGHGGKEVCEYENSCD